MKIRPAKESDKEEILSFCVNTFSWGDYIDRVWDYWFKSGLLLVVEESGKKIGMSHMTLCQDGKLMWLEGVRVHPSHKRSGIATRLLDRMIEYGLKKGARQASAIVDITNTASQQMMEKNGFSVISRWAYYRMDGTPSSKNSNARFATSIELDNIWSYLQNSKIFRMAANRYIKSWHWYILDKKTLHGMVKKGQAVITGQPIDGIAIINTVGYWDKSDILQVVYLDTNSTTAIKSIISFVTNIYLDGKYKEFQLVCNDNKHLTSYIGELMIRDEEQFLLYDKVFTARTMTNL